MAFAQNQLSNGIRPESIVKWHFQKLNAVNYQEIKNHMFLCVRHYIYLT